MADLLAQARTLTLPAHRGPQLPACPAPAKRRSFSGSKRKSLSCPPSTRRSSSSGLDLPDTRPRYTRRAPLLKPVLIAGLQQGGQLMFTTDVENYPGFADPIQGPWLMGADAEAGAACRRRDRQRHRDGGRRQCAAFRIQTDSGACLYGRRGLIATGAQAKWLGIPSEATYMGFGVSACATCDGFFYRGKDVAVIGGGNSAVEEASTSRIWPRA